MGVMEGFAGVRAAEEWLSDLDRALRRHAYCDTCGSKVQKLQRFDEPGLSRFIRFVATCHGKREERIVDEEDCLRRRLPEGFIIFFRRPPPASYRYSRPTLRELLERVVKARGI